MTHPDTLTIPRAVVEQALEALENAYSGSIQGYHETFDNLHAALQPQADTSVLQAAPWPPQATAEPSIPAGFALVPIQTTRAMEEVFAEEGWEWANLLAAAEAVTLEQYEYALSTTPPATQAALTAALDYLWVVVEHNRLHFGDSHNTVIQGKAAIAQIEALKGSTP